ncbi:hypothetical protein Dsin_006209 [Dipteronia sinensis]|uniref:Uncharacterized protein n=1 Tax=Dipteronia sinensis TaxID=43782 RepID=A0AAE0AZ65_9ROSI|nr:hypothetical protein Dsin_006209 [Dipteronia sinensis]
MFIATSVCLQAIGFYSFSISSFGLHTTEQRTDNVDLKKKRKLGADLLGLPAAKHKCWNGSLTLKSLEMEDNDATIIKVTAEGGHFDERSKQESANDSNSFEESFDSAMSGHGESKFESENGITCSYQRLSSSSNYWSFCSFKDSSNSSDSTSMTEGVVDKQQTAFVGEEHPPSHHVDGLHVAENFDNPPIGYGSHNVHDLCPGYGNDTEDQYTGEVIEDILHLNEVNPNSFVLSSGRWGLNQESEIGKRKPTIDQEFEQYFSMLML